MAGDGNVLHGGIGGTEERAPSLIFAFFSFRKGKSPLPQRERVGGELSRANARGMKNLLPD